MKVMHLNERKDISVFSNVQICVQWQDGAQLLQFSALHFQCFAYCTYSILGRVCVQSPGSSGIHWTIILRLRCEMTVMASYICCHIISEDIGENPRSPWMILPRGKPKSERKKRKYKQRRQEWTGANGNDCCIVLIRETQLLPSRLDCDIELVGCTAHRHDRNAPVKADKGSYAVYICDN